MFEIKPAREHFEVYLDGKFYCSVDTEAEAEKEIEKFLWLTASLEETMDMC